MPGGVPDLTPRYSLDWSAAQNWVDRVGDLPKYIASVATALIDDAGMDRGHAIATAVNTVRIWCETGIARNLKGNPRVSGAVRAAACANYAEWRAKVAAA